MKKACFLPETGLFYFPPSQHHSAHRRARPSAPACRPPEWRGNGFRVLSQL